jgi:UDP-glucose 4-epimerase
LFAVPKGLLRLVAILMGKTSAVDRLFGSLYLDSTKIQRELQWKPPFPLQEGLNETAHVLL